MSNILLYIAFSFFATLILIPPIIWVFNKEQIHDLPDERKVHTFQKPSMGGLAIFTGLVFSLGLSGVNGSIKDANYFLTAISLILFVGVLDDLLSLRPLFKLLVQIPASLLIIHFAGIRIDNFYGLFGIHEISIFLSYPITVFTFIVVINAFNLIDGIDGLAGSTALLIFLVLGLWMFATGNNSIAIACFMLFGAISAFLVFNWEPSKIFMGDTGALFLGFVLAAMVIYFINSAGQLNESIPPYLHFESNVTAAICLLILPMVDTLRVYIKRVMAGKSPFAPDKNHLHHVLMRIGLSHASTVLILISINAAFILLAYLGKNFSDNIMLPFVVLVATGLVYILEKFDERAAAKASLGKKPSSIQNTTQIDMIKSEAKPSFS